MSVPARFACHCGNISVQMKLPAATASYQPRACDCDFCVQHGGEYVTDPKGSLRIEIRDKNLLSKYRQGSDSADFLICKTCGVLMGVIYEEAGVIYAAINSRAARPAVQWGDTVKVSPKTLAAEEKIQRWKQIWFKWVSIEWGPK